MLWGVGETCSGVCGGAGNQCEVEWCVCVVVQGTSVKYSPQQVGLAHTMQDEDVIQVVKK